MGYLIPHMRMAIVSGTHRSVMIARGCRSRSPTRAGTIITITEPAIMPSLGTQSR
jgi:hypothetical protein